MRNRAPRLVVAAGLPVALLLFAPSLSLAAETKQLLVVLDGLRPDYVTPELMPNLHGLAERGVFFENHHSVYPTVTRVNSPSISTGTYPERHGLMGNSVYFPQVDSEDSLTTSERDNLLRIEKATGGRLLEAVTLGEVLAESGGKLMVGSSGSTGSSYLLNHTVAGGAIIHYDYVLPEELRSLVYETLGPPPAESSINLPRHRWIVDAYLEIGIDQLDADASILWLSDPDSTAHAHGIGAPDTLVALAAVDGEIGRLVAGLETRGLGDNVNIFVTSDHGFSTHRGGADPAGIVEQTLGPDAAVVAGGAVYLRQQPARLTELVRALQQAEWVGAIFTRAAQPGDALGAVAGTLSFGLIGWDHERSGDLLFSPDWSDENNDFGYRGSTTMPGVAGHGTTSPWDIHNTLVAAGPDLKESLRTAVPSSNVDLAPTLCHLLGLTPPATMTGRVLAEVLSGGPDPSTVAVEAVQHTARAPGYELTAHFSVVGTHRYLDRTVVRRPGP